MSREKKFHKLIESQDQESKQKAWEHITSQIDYEENTSENVPITDGETVVLGKRRNLIYLGCFLLILIAVLIGGFYLIVSHHNDIDSPSIDNPSDIAETPPEGIRYSYTAADYTERYIDETLKDISEQNGGKILYFNWYAAAEELNTVIAEANVDHRIVYYLETSVDPNTGYNIQLGVTDNRTQVDVFAKYGICNQTMQINHVDVKWAGDMFVSYATFECNGYCYYLEIQDLEQTEDILEYVRELLTE